VAAHVPSIPDPDALAVAVVADAPAALVAVPALLAAAPDAAVVGAVVAAALSAFSNVSLGAGSAWMKWM
jgi:hypothetical protein